MSNPEWMTSTTLSSEFDKFDTIFLNYREDTYGIYPMLRLVGDLKIEGISSNVGLEVNIFLSDDTGADVDFFIFDGHHNAHIQVRLQDKCYRYIFDSFCSSLSSKEAEYRVIFQIEKSQQEVNKLFYNNTPRFDIELPTIHVSQVRNFVPTSAAKPVATETEHLEVIATRERDARNNVGKPNTSEAPDSLQECARLIRGAVVTKPASFTEWKWDLEEISPLKVLGYTVGKRGWVDSKRRDFLDDFIAVPLPTSIRKEYRDQWGRPDSNQRFDRTISHLKANADRHEANDPHRYDVAIREWREDADYLQKRWKQSQQRKDQRSFAEKALSITQSTDLTDAEKADLLRRLLE